MLCHRKLYTLTHRSCWIPQWCVCGLGVSSCLSAELIGWATMMTHWSSNKDTLKRCHPWSTEHWYCMGVSGLWLQHHWYPCMGVCGLWLQLHWLPFFFFIILRGWEDCCPLCGKCSFCALAEDGRKGFLCPYRASMKLLPWVTGFLPGWNEQFSMRQRQIEPVSVGCP